MDSSQFLFQIQSLPLGGEASSAVDEAYIKGVYAGLNLLSSLTHGSFDPAAEAQNLYHAPMTKQLFAAAEAPPLHFLSEPEAFSSHHGENLPNLLSLEAAAGSESGLRIKRELGKVRSPAKRSRFQGVTEKARRLQNLLPWDKKMDTATALEETYKYIKFLEAQVSVLRSMPIDHRESGGGGGEGRASTTKTENVGDLGMLNRQQLLQVLVNSPAAQTALYSNACCVYSVEQMDLVKKKAEREALLDIKPYDSNPNPPFYSW